MKILVTAEYKANFKTEPPTYYYHAIAQLLDVPNPVQADARGVTMVEAIKAACSIAIETSTRIATNRRLRAAAARENQPELPPVISPRARATEFSLLPEENE